MKTIFFFVVIIFYSSIIYPCSCLFQHPSEAYEKAQLIFIGLSISVGEDSISFYRFKSLFKVERIFKGEELSEVEILSDISSCGVYFPSGYKFLIYSYKSKDGYYYTGKCTRSNILKSAIIDLIFLNSLPEALNQSSLAGHLYNYEDVNKDYWDLPPFDYTPVMIFNDKKIYETVTDKNGLYKFENIDPGMYKFKFGVSSKYTTQFSFDELIDIKQNEFKEINQILVPNGIICGHLKDINGKALQRVFVDLMPVN